MIIEHDPDHKRFVVRLPSGVAVLEYAPAGDGILDFHHTHVPSAARGQGIAGRLVEGAFTWARGQGYRVIPSCSYVDAWITRHPQLQDLLAAGH